MALPRFLGPIISITYLYKASEEKNCSKSMIKINIFKRGNKWKKRTLIMPDIE